MRESVARYQSRGQYARVIKRLQRPLAPHYFMSAAHILLGTTAGYRAIGRPALGAPQERHCTTTLCIPYRHLQEWLQRESEAACARQIDNHTGSHRSKTSLTVCQGAYHWRMPKCTPSHQNSATASLLKLNIQTSRWCLGICNKIYCCVLPVALPVSPQHFATP